MSQCEPVVKSNVLIIIRGLPGSGKTTMARKLMEAGAVTKHFEADMFFEVDGEYKFDSKKLPDAHQWCRSEVMAALLNGENVVVSNTFVKKWEVEPYIQACLESNINYVILTASGEYGSVHDVPEETIAKMKRKWEKF